MSIFGPLVGPMNLSGHVDLGQFLRIRRHLLTVDEKDCRQGNRRADLAIAAVDVENVTDGDLLLVPAAADDRVHRGLTLSNGQSGARNRQRRGTDVGATRASLLGYGRAAIRVKP